MILHYYLRTSGAGIIVRELEAAAARISFLCRLRHLP